MTRDARLSLAFLGLHPARRAALVERFGGTTAAVTAIRRGRAESIAPSRLVSPDACRAAVAAVGCRVVFFEDTDYPTPLGDIADPPDPLFVEGSLPAVPAVAVVGTRRCTTYGRNLAASYGRAVAEAGWVLVSGLARGIDGAAHTGTVEQGGIGVAVLGCGLDVSYPKEHRRLRQRLLEAGGAVVTEYPPGTPPEGWRFPPRNRIISGLARVVVVVESGATGGSLVTAARAVEQGREVFAVPGDVGRESSLGCNLLIRDGAVPVLGPEDLVEALSLVLGPPRQRASLEGWRHEDGEEVLKAISPVGIHLDALAEVTGMTTPSLLSLLGRLEVGGWVRRDGNTVFRSA